jgi:hypothetical protein
MRKVSFVFSFLFIILFADSAFSQDRNFARTYQSITLPKGVKDLEVWNTFRSGRDNFYRRIDQRVEFEVGLTDKLQMALYLNASHIAAVTFPENLGPVSDPLPTIGSESEFSFSSEWKWRLSSADANKVGFALYGEATFAPKETELEGKIILDKRTEKNIFALNLVGEMEWEVGLAPGGGVETEEETVFETDLAWMHMFKNNFGLGIELRNNNVFEESEEHSALFGGPTLFFSGNKYFLILNVLPQWARLKTDNVPGSLDLREYEKVEVRLLLGFSL